TAGGQAPGSTAAGPPPPPSTPAGGIPGPGAAAASAAAAVPQQPAHPSPPASAAQPAPAPAAPAAEPSRAAALAQSPAPAQPSRPSAAAPSAPPGSPGPTSPATPAGTAAPRPAAPAPASATPRSAKSSTGKSRSVDVLSELEKLRREAMQPAPSPTGTHPAGQPPSAAALLGAQTAPARAKSGAAGISSNGRAELSRNIEMTLKRSEFARARRILLSFQVEDDQHRVVDAVRDLQVEIKGTADLEKLLLRFNIALHAKE
ncbi:MAG TPA: hypothetical protein VE075_03520, partial [Thermoanaerobaculia bacterium]|nr:hypothetical protein [Thermoanaerobaculia bacterium]